MTIIRRAAIATVFSCWVVLIGLACRPLPEPVTPPGPVVDPVDPPSDLDAGPGSTACERACAKADELDCDHDGAPDPQCPGACERYEEMGGAFRRNPECQARASTCAEHKACRAGGP